ncbi:hypothetical protein SMACR_00165 [Sordaria macrospora]|nr:hypothetical protein SMACR_00165 [Sordaria macrospora]KAH7632280.1 hypothetical protein B0T09DRAFT_118653 [Sordaria sp. MPI-SDFR-AT-0083]WPJ63550.1 hypothetical protein SMAC4_00165 [Sordaria macrospora]
MSYSSLLSPGPYHIISYGTLLGTTFFHSFVGGIISFQVLPRPQFSALMTKIFPVYFSMQTAIPIVLALTYPGATTAFGSAGAAGIVGVLDPDNRWLVLAPIAAIFLTGVANLAVVGPATTKCMKERKHQETKDGKKSYDAPPHSQEMTALNKRFSQLHGISSLLNLGNLIAAVAYGFTLASRLD